MVFGLYWRGGLWSRTRRWTERGEKREGIEEGIARSRDFADVSLKSISLDHHTILLRIPPIYSLIHNIQCSLHPYSLSTLEPEDVSREVSNDDPWV
jgi:hypothetical protein